MDSVKHYKLFKKGKNWCVMAITTAVAIAGITLSVNHVQADTVDSTTQVASTNATNNTANDINQSSIANEQLNSEGTQDLSFNNSKNALNNDENYVDQYDYSQSKVVNPTYQSNYNQNNVTENGWGSDGLYYQNGQVVKNSTINVDDGTYWLDDNGQIAKDHFQEQDGKMYYFGLDGKEYKNQFYQNWGHTYYFGDDGARWDNRFYQNWGHTYYFGDDGARWDNRFYQDWGHTYYFGDDGARWDNRYYFNWGNTYYFGSDGARLDNSVRHDFGSAYYFGNDGALVKNTTLNLNGKTYVANNDGVLTENDAASKADRALTMLGTPYVWGGNQPGGFDCSGLVQWAFGLGSNYRTTYQQTNLGAHQYNVYSAPKGSLVFFGSDSSPYHVGISLGDGTFVHAPEPGDVVKITKMRYYTPSYYIVLN